MGALSAPSKNHPALRRTQPGKLNRTLLATDVNQESLAILEKIWMADWILIPVRNWRWEAAQSRDSAQVEGFLYSEAIPSGVSEQNLAILAPRAVPRPRRLDEITRGAPRHINPLQMTLREGYERKRTPVRGPEWMYRSLAAGESAGFDAIDGA